MAHWRTILSKADLASRKSAKTGVLFLWHSELPVPTGSLWWMELNAIFRLDSLAPPVGGLAVAGIQLAGF